MTEIDPLQALWAADEPAARDRAFATAAVARATALPQAPGPMDVLRGVLRRGLTGLGVGGALAGTGLLLQTGGAEPWTLLILAAALAGALWGAGRLVLAD